VKLVIGIVHDNKRIGSHRESISLNNCSLLLKNSTLYLVIGDPLSLGAVQEKTTEIPLIDVTIGLI
jgi:hypothetical protein